MPNTTEKLVDIIINTPCVAVSSRTAAEHIINHLVANGITFQKWKQVSIAPKDGLYIVKLKNGKKLPARYNCGSWIMCEGYKNITNDVVEWKEVE